MSAANIQQQAPINFLKMICNIMLLLSVHLCQSLSFFFLCRLVWSRGAVRLCVSGFGSSSSNSCDQKQLWNFCCIQIWSEFICCCTESTNSRICHHKKRRVSFQTWWVQFLSDTPTFLTLCYLPLSRVPHNKIDIILSTVRAATRKGRAELAHC